MNNKHQLLMDFLLCSGFWGVWGGGLDIGYAASEVGGGGQEAAPGLGGVIVGLPTSTAFSRSVFLVGGLETVGEPSLYLSKFNHLHKHTC